jgi:hypothetical protein
MGAGCSAVQCVVFLLFTLLHTHAHVWNTHIGGEEMGRGDMDRRTHLVLLAARDGPGAAAGGGGVRVAVAARGGALLLLLCVCLCCFWVVGLVRDETAGIGRGRVGEASPCIPRPIKTSIPPPPPTPTPTPTQPQLHQNLKRTESESESEEEELEEDEEEDDDDVLSSSDSAAAPASPPMSFSSPMNAAGSSRYLPSSASCALAALFSLFFIRLNDRSFPGDIFLAVPSFACGVRCVGGGFGWLGWLVLVLVLGRGGERAKEAVTVARTICPSTTQSPI